MKRRSLLTMFGVLPLVPLINKIPQINENQLIPVIKETSNDKVLVIQRGIIEGNVLHEQSKFELIANDDMLINTPYQCTTYLRDDGIIINTMWNLSKKEIADCDIRKLQANYYINDILFVNKEFDTNKYYFRRKNDDTPYMFQFIISVYVSNSDFSELLV